MIDPPDMLDLLQSAAVSAWSGSVYRHMFGSHLPSHANTHGARWNDAGLGAITALAEAEYSISLQPLRPRAKRKLYTLRVSLENVIDLTAPGLLQQLGITEAILSGPDHGPCRMIGGAVHWLGHDGLLVPSARRSGGTNLVIYQQDLATSDFEVIGEEVIAPDDRV
jgi:RES domain-containing protein